MMRRVALAIVLLAAALAPATAAPATQRVVLLVPGTLGSGPFHLANERGYFRRFGIEAVIQREDTPIGLAALNLGAADLFFATAGPTLFGLAARGGRVRAVSSGSMIATQCTSIALVVTTRYYREHQPFSVGELRGARIATNSYADGGLTHFVLTRVFARAGMTDRDVTLLRLSFPAQVAALESGGVDAAFLTEPFLSGVLARGTAVIAARARDVAAGYPAALNVAGPTLLRRPGVASRLLAGWLLGVRDFIAPDAMRNPETARILAAALGQPEDAIRKTCRNPVRPDGAIDTQKLTEMRDWYVAQGLLDEPVPLSRVVDDRFLREAWRLLEAAGERVR